MATTEKIEKITKEEALRIIKDGQKGQSLRQYAFQLGVSPQYLSDVYNDKRNPGEAILETFGITKKATTTIEYFCVRGKK